MARKNDREGGGGGSFVGSTTTGSGGAGFGIGGGTSSGGGGLGSIGKSIGASIAKATPKKNTYSSSLNTRKPRTPVTSSTRNSTRSSNVTRPAVGSNSSGAISKTVTTPVVATPTPKPAAPAVPTIDQWLAKDAVYNQQKNAFNKALADYLAQYNNQQNQYTTDFNANLGNIGKDQELQRKALEDDYASRGLMNSGLFADALNQFNTGYDERRTAMETAKANFLTNLLSQRNNYNSEQQALLDKAKQDAVNRYNTSLNITA